MWFRKKKEVLPAKVSTQGHPLYVETTPVEVMSPVKRRQRHENRLRICQNKLDEFDAQGMDKKSDLYEGWALELEKRKLAIRQLDLEKKRRVR